MKTESPFALHDRLLTSGWIDAAPAMKFIDARQAFDVVISNSISREVSASDFGPVTPPFDDIWLEGIDTEASTGTERYRLAARVRTGVDAVSAKDKSELATNSIEVYTMGATGLSQRIPASVAFTTDENGHLDRFTKALISDDDIRYHMSEPEGTANRIAQRVGICALFAISLMHCKNVKPSKGSYQPPKRRKTSRQRPSIEYHVIDVPGYQTSASGSGAATGTTKLHTARGHFKTYTAEAPLMGQHVGTYYWGPHVRGRKENGEVISSYKVGNVA